MALEVYEEAIAGLKKLLRYSILFRFWPRDSPTRKLNCAFPEADEAIFRYGRISRPINHQEFHFNTHSSLGPTLTALLFLSSSENGELEGAAAAKVKKLMTELSGAAASKAGFDPVARIQAGFEHFKKDNYEYVDFHFRFLRIRWKLNAF